MNVKLRPSPKCDTSWDARSPPVTVSRMCTRTTARCWNARSWTASWPVQPFWRHGVLLPDLFRAGVPVFTEKPLSCSVEAGEAIVKALQSSSSRYYVGYHKRSDPASLYARREIERLVESGELGALRYVRIIMPAGDWVAGGNRPLLSTDEPSPQGERDALPADMDEETQGKYSSFVNYYIHQVNLMRYLLGEDYHVDYADPSGVVLAVQSESGVAGTIEMSPLPHDHRLAGGGPGGFRTRLCEARAALAIGQ